MDLHAGLSEVAGITRIHRDGAKGIPAPLKYHDGNYLHADPLTD